MQKKQRYIVLIFTAAVIFFMFGLNYHASALEINYPLIPGFPDINKDPALLNYISYFFGFAMATAGIIGVISIVIAGFQILISAGSPSAINEARDRLFGAVLGIVLLMTSFILLMTINPSLINPGVLGISNALSPGVYLIGPNKVDECLGVIIGDGGLGDGGCKDAAHPDGFIYELSEPYVPSTDLETFTGLLYYCPAITNGSNLLLWRYNDYEFIVDNDVSGDDGTIVLPCGNTDPNKAVSLKNILSFTWQYQSPGVYYYMTQGCTGPATSFDEGSPGQKISGDIPWFDDPDVNPALDQTVRSLKILNYPGQDFNYGVILTNSMGVQGECSEEIIETVQEKSLKDAKCTTILTDNNEPVVSTLDGEPFFAWSAHIIKQERNASNNPRNKGLTFYSNNKQYSLSQKGRAVEAGKPNPNIEQLWVYSKNNPPATIDYPGISLSNDGNIDNAIRLFGKPANNKKKDAPSDECLAYRPEIEDQVSGQTYDCTFDDPLEAEVNACHSKGKGYLSCVNKIFWEGNYNVVLYTHNEETFNRSCQIFDNSFSTLMFDGSEDPPYSNLLEIFTQFQTVYRTVVFPSK